MRRPLRRWNPSVNYIQLKKPDAHRECEARAARDNGQEVCRSPDGAQFVNYAHRVCVLCVCVRGIMFQRTYYTMRKLGGWLVLLLGGRCLHEHDDQHHQHQPPPMSTTMSELWRWWRLLPHPYTTRSRFFVCFGCVCSRRTRIHWKYNGKWWLLSEPKTRANAPNESAQNNAGAAHVPMENNSRTKNPSGCCTVHVHTRAHTNKLQEKCLLRTNIYNILCRTHCAFGVRVRGLACVYFGGWRVFILKQNRLCQHNIAARAARIIDWSGAFLSVRGSLQLKLSIHIVQSSQIKLWIRNENVYFSALDFGEVRALSISPKCVEGDVAAWMSDPWKGLEQGQKDGPIKCRKSILKAPPRVAWETSRFVLIWLLFAHWTQVDTIGHKSASSTSI